MRKLWLKCVAALLLGAVARPAWAGDDDPPPLRPSALDEAVVPRPLFDWHRYGKEYNHEEPVPLPPSEEPFPRSPSGNLGCFTIGAGAYLLRPTFENNPALVFRNGAATRQIDFSEDVEVAPTAWIGLVGDHGWGLRVRWFHIGVEASEQGAVLPGETVLAVTPLLANRTVAADSIAASSTLYIDTFDLEGTCLSYHHHLWAVTFGIGARYAHLSQSYRATAVGAGGVTEVASGHNFNGAGPTLSLQGTRRLGHSCVSLYGNAYGALLFGTSNEDYFVRQGGAPIPNLLIRENSVLPYAEAEVGLEFSKPVGHARVFLQTGVVGQGWWNAGSAGNFDPTTNTFESSSNLGFFGLAIRAGANF